MYKISHFKLAKDIIKSACLSSRCHFSDIIIETDENGFVGLKDGKIFFGNPIKMPMSVYNIVFVYFNNFEEISGVKLFSSEKQKQEVYLTIFNFLRSLSYFSIDNFVYYDTIVSRIYQYPLIWILMKDIIEPVYNISINNTKVILNSNPLMDVSHFNKCDVEEGEDFIFLNGDISYEPCKLAYLLNSVLEAHGLDANKVIKNILDSELKNKLIGLLKLAFKEENFINDFITTISSSVEIDNKMESMIYNFKGNKTAQYETRESTQSGNSTGSWWYLGLIEKMLEPVRGDDWTVYHNLEPFRKELWDKIEKARKKVGREGLNYEALLRIQSGENSKDNVKLIEKMLGSDRVW